MRAQRRCSFCRSENHSIRYCDSPEFQGILENEKSYIERMIMVPQRNLSELLRSHLHGKTLRELRVIATQYHLRTNLSLEGYVSLLKEKYIEDIIRLSSLYFTEINRPVQSPEYSDIVYHYIREIEYNEYNDIVLSESQRNRITDVILDMFEDETSIINNSIINNVHVSFETPDLITSLFRTQPLTPPHSPPRKRKIPTMFICMEQQNELEQCVECPICLDHKQVFDNVQLNCNHSFCTTCIIKHIDVTKKNASPNCPLCRTDIKMFEVKSVETYNLLENKYS